MFISSEGKYMKNVNKELMDLLLEDCKGSVKSAEFSYNSSLFVKANIGYIKFGTKKPAINTQMWFDDEKKMPEKTKELFIAYNESNMPSLIELGPTRNFGAEWVKGLEKRNGYYVLTLRHASQEKEMQTLTQEIVDLMNAEIKKAQADYMKRLENYWKRYNAKVRVSGYWVNR
jgi:hypothetical protein